MIPEERHPAVARALEAAFGVRDYDTLEPLAAADGMSTAFVYRMMIGDRPYLLRLIKETIAGIDPTREFAYMRAASEAGIAPRVWYASVDDCLMISDFVDTKPYPPDAASKLATTIRHLHAQTGFTPTTKALDGLDVFVRRFASAGLLPAAKTDVLMRLYDEAIAVYPRDEADWVLSHNDLKPQNILYDGDRFLLIDWEAAFMNDRYHDLAMVANFFANTEPEADALLTAYFGAPPTDYQRARFFLMSQLLHVSYVAMFALIAARSGVSGELATPAPDFGDFHRRIVAGELDLSGAEAKLQYAHVHLNRALEQMWSQRFVDAVALVGDRQTDSSLRNHSRRL